MKVQSGRCRGILIGENACAVSHTQCCGLAHAEKTLVSLGVLAYYTHTHTYIQLNTTQFRLAQNWTCTRSSGTY